MFLCILYSSFISLFNKYGPNISLAYNYASILPLMLGFAGGLISILFYKKRSKILSFLGFCSCLMGLSITLVLFCMVCFKNFLFIFNLYDIYYNVLRWITWIFVGMPL